MGSPLRPFALALLTAVAAGESHGYALREQMMVDVNGDIVVNGLSVYRELQRLSEKGLLTVVPSTHPVRYRLTARGRQGLAYERGRALRTYQLLQERL
jgi:DNA-binding PadR family transcriptional regulator